MLRRFRKDGVHFLLCSKLNSLPLEGKVGGGLRRSDEVVRFYLLVSTPLGSNFSTSSVAYAPASPQGEAK